MSAREGWRLLAWAIWQLVALGLLFQAANIEGWGGIATFATLAAFLVGLVALSLGVARARRVHPRGVNRALRLAGVWTVLVVAVAGWFWIAQGPHSTSIWVTSAVALAAVAPAMIVAVRLVRAGR